LLVDRVVNVEDRATGVAKQVFYAFFGEDARDDICAIEFHEIIPFITGFATMTALFLNKRH